MDAVDKILYKKKLCYCWSLYEELHRSLGTGFFGRSTKGIGRNFKL
jgi:hypothetical protein